MELKGIKQIIETETKVRNLEYLLELAIKEDNDTLVVLITKRIAELRKEKE